MSIPNLKRVTISSVQQLENWVQKNADLGHSVMLVLFDKTGGERFIEPDVVSATLTAQGLNSGRRYTLHGNLIGHVVEPK